MTLAEIDPLAQLSNGTCVAVNAHMDMENEARPRHKAIQTELGVGDEETRQAREATQLSSPARQSTSRTTAASPASDRVRRRPRAGDRRRRRLADAVRRGPRARRQARRLLRDRRRPVGRKACGLAKLVLQKPGVDRIAVMMSIVSNMRVDIVARGVIKACVELATSRRRRSDLPHPGRIERGRLQDLEVRREVRGPKRLFERGGADGGGGMTSSSTRRPRDRPGHHRPRGVNLTRESSTTAPAPASWAASRGPARREVHGVRCRRSRRRSRRTPGR